MNHDKNPSSRSLPRFATVAAIGALAALLAAGVACENSDPTAPEGSTITVSASPQTAQPSVDVLITATVRSANGTRLPDQEVVFTTTNGLLKPVAQTPILTDSKGQATTILTTSQVATVTATTGTISSSTTVQVSTCAVQTILLNLSQTSIASCMTPVDVTLTALDTSGGVCGGLAVSLSAGPTGQSGVNELRGSFASTQGVTDASGKFMTVWTPVLNDCQQNCMPSVNPQAPNGGSCAADFEGEDSAGSVTSVPVRLTETAQ